MVPGVTLDLDSVVVMTDSFNFTISWGAPFENFAAILNYTITISCTGGICPVKLTNDNVTTSRNIRYTTTMTNVTLMVTAGNIVGESDPVVLEITCELHCVSCYMYVCSFSESYLRRITSTNILANLIAKLSQVLMVLHCVNRQLDEILYFVMGIFCSS